jgi:hypothetical protein
MHNLGRIGFAAAYVFLGLIGLFVAPLLTPASVPRATGHFEEYCDGVGFFLAKVDGAPASGKLVFFSYMGFPGARSAANISDRGNGPTYLSLLMGASPMASARASLMAEYGLTR